MQEMQYKAKRKVRDMKPQQALAGKSIVSSSPNTTGWWDQVSTESSCDELSFGHRRLERVYKRYILPYMVNISAKLSRHKSKPTLLLPLTPQSLHSYLLPVPHISFQLPLPTVPEILARLAPRKQLLMARARGPQLHDQYKDNERGDRSDELEGV